MKNFSHLLFDEVYTYDKIVSTSKQAEKLIRNQNVQGNFLVIAAKQSGGIGRNRNHWFSPEGGIWLTTALYGLQTPPSIPLFTGICIHKTLCSTFPNLASKLTLKWPNDIYLENRKLSGILSQKMEAFNYHLLGIGLNSNICELPEDLKENAISLRSVLKREIDNRDLIIKLFDLIASDLPEFVENNFDSSYFNQHSFLNGKQIVLDTDFDRYAGKCKGVNKDGALLIELKSGMIQPFYAGTVLNWK